MFAVPGEITSALSTGSNALLRLGATPLTKVDDVLEALGVAAAEPVAAPDLSAPAAAVLERLREAPAAVDELVRTTGLGAGAIAVALSELELAGVVREGEGVFRPT